MSDEWPEYIAAKPDKTWANMPHGQTYVHIRRHMLISGNLDDAKKRITDLEAQLAQRDAALKAAQVVLRECMDEIDGYVRQEYPGDHPVHERYRKRDFSANPARVYLNARKDTP